MTSNLTQTQQFLGLRRFYPFCPILPKNNPMSNSYPISFPMHPICPKSVFITWFNTKITNLPICPCFPQLSKLSNFPNVTQFSKSSNHKIGKINSLPMINIEFTNTNISISWPTNMLSLISQNKSTINLKTWNWAWNFQRERDKVPTSRIWEEDEEIKRRPNAPTRNFAKPRLLFNKSLSTKARRVFFPSMTYPLMV